MPKLVQHFGERAKFIYDCVRGMHDEPVKVGVGRIISSLQSKTAVIQDTESLRDTAKVCMSRCIVLGNTAFCSRLCFAAHDIPQGQAESTSAWVALYLKQVSDHASTRNLAIESRTATVHIHSSINQLLNFT